MNQPFVPGMPGYPPQQGAPWGQPQAQPQQGAPWGQPQAQPQQGAPWGQPQAQPQQGAPWGQPQAPAQPQGGGGGWMAALMGADPTAVGGGKNLIGIDGDFVVDIESIKVHKSQDPTKGSATYFIVETVIVETTNPAIPPGDRRSWVCDLSRNTGANEALAFTLQVCESIMGRKINQSELTNKILGAIAGPGNPAKGCRFQLTTYTKPQKRDPSKTFTKHTWTPMQKGEVRGLQPTAAPVQPAAPAGLPPMPSAQPQGAPPAPAGLPPASANPWGQPPAQPPQGAPWGQPPAQPPQGAPWGQPPQNHAPAQGGPPPGWSAGPWPPGGQQ